MGSIQAAHALLIREAHGLMTRVQRIRPFAQYEPMVPAANVSALARNAIERSLADGRSELRRRIQDYLRWLNSPIGSSISPPQARRRLSLLRLRFNAVLTRFDLFADVLTQRSEHEAGIWLAGLDAAAADALALPGYYRAPPAVCYLDRGMGAAIRRARTRLPGGGENPVAIIRVPRERMVGSGVASSLFHEVGHQAAALLNLVASLRSAIAAHPRVGTGGWVYWDRWISEILADLWAVARLGVGATLGLVATLNLPRAFVFRVELDDPHPFPWIRIRLGCALGQSLYPDPQWERLARIWKALYPLASLPADIRRLIAELEAGMPDLIGLILAHRPYSLRGRSLIEVLDTAPRQPQRLRATLDDWLIEPMRMYRMPPALVLAVLGQAAADERLSPQGESRLLGKLLTHWALQGALRTPARCATA